MPQAETRRVAPRRPHRAHRPLWSLEPMAIADWASGCSAGSHMISRTRARSVRFGKDDTVVQAQSATDRRVVKQVDASRCKRSPERPPGALILPRQPLCLVATNSALVRYRPNIPPLCRTVQWTSSRRWRCRARAILAYGSQAICSNHFLGLALSQARVMCRPIAQKRPSREQ
jgi:hypothetical protein